MPLKNENEEEETNEILNYRRQKQREFERKEDERKAEEAKKRKMEEFKKEIR